MPAVVETLWTGTATWRKNFLGMHLDNWPAKFGANALDIGPRYRIGLVRLHDYSGSQWFGQETADGVYDATRMGLMDQLMVACRTRGYRVLFVVNGCPDWATTRDYITKAFTGDGSTVTFTLDEVPSSTTGVEVRVAGALKALGTDYTVNFTSPNKTVTFTAAPANAAAISVKHKAKIGPYNTTGAQWAPGAPGAVDVSKLRRYVKRTLELYGDLFDFVEVLNEPRFYPGGTNETTPSSNSGAFFRDTADAAVQMVAAVRAEVDAYNAARGTTITVTSPGFTGESQRAVAFLNALAAYGSYPCEVINWHSYDGKLRLCLDGATAVDAPASPVGARFTQSIKTIADLREAIVKPGGQNPTGSELQRTETARGFTRKGFTEGALDVSVFGGYSKRQQASLFLQFYAMLAATGHEYACYYTHDTSNFLCPARNRAIDRVCRMMGAIDADKTMTGIYLLADGNTRVTFSDGTVFES